MRSHRVHGARWASGLRRDRRRGARAVRGQLGPGALPPPGRSGRHHRRSRHGRYRAGARRRSPRRDQATGGERAHAVGCPHPTDARDIRAQPLDARDPGRVTGAGRRHVRHPLPARRVRLPGPEPELDGDDRLLGRLRRLLLRAHLRLAPDLHRANDPAPRAPRRPAARRVRGVEGDRPRAVPPPRRRGDAGCASPAGPPPQSPAVDVRLDGRRPAAVRGRGPRPRPAHLRHRSETWRRRRSPCRCCAFPPCCSRVPSSR